MTVYLPVWH